MVSLTCNLLCLWYAFKGVLQRESLSASKAGVNLPCCSLDPRWAGMKLHLTPDDGMGVIAPRAPAACSLLQAIVHTPGFLLLSSASGPGLLPILFFFNHLQGCRRRRGPRDHTLSQASTSASGPCPWLASLFLKEICFRARKSLKERLASPRPQQCQKWI